MLDAFVLDGTVTLVAMAAIVLELLIVVGIAVAKRRSPSASLVANTLSGLFLILALRAALLDQGSGPVALFLALAGVAHLGDLAMRFRKEA